MTMKLLLLGGVLFAQYAAALYGTSNGTTLNCSGQIVQPATQKRDMGHGLRHSRHYVRDLTTTGSLHLNGTTCDQLSQTYGVATGELQAKTNDTVCTMNGPLCLLAACSLYQVPENSTW